MNAKYQGLIICFMLYTIAFIVGIYAANQTLATHQWIVVSIAHLAATCVVFAGSFIYKNSSLYDPFWSVVPAPIAIYLAFWPESITIDYEKIILVLIPVLFWSLRLTWNWAKKWEGLIEEDFRYVNLKKGSKAKVVFIDFFGIHIFPTFQVNLSLLPIYYILVVPTNEVNLAMYLASSFTFLAVLLETIADKQMYAFANNPNNKGTTMRQGLWKYSRHPNYLGEVSFWLGLYFMALSAGSSPSWLFICPLSMYLMFALVTCRMMDNRSLARRSDYAEYMKNTSQLFLWPPKSN